MSPVPFVPSAPFREAWRRSLLGAGAWILAIFVLAMAAAIRVSGVEGSPVRPAGELALLTILIAAVLLLLLITGVMVAVEQFHDRFGRRNPEIPGPGHRPDLPNAAAALAAALAFLAANNLVYRFLPIPLASGTGWVFIPLVGIPALHYVTSLLGLLAIETGLAVWWILERRAWAWYLARAATGALWCAFLVSVIAGGNPLAGDPLEWAARLGSPPISPVWLARAPHVMAPWWPALRVGIVAALLATLLALVAEAREALARRKSDE